MKENETKGYRIPTVITCNTCKGEKVIRLNDGREIHTIPCTHCGGEGKVTILAWG